MEILDLSELKFTEEADKVYSDSGIFNPKFSNVKTFKGDDEIIGNYSINSDFGLGIIGESKAGVKAENTSGIVAADLSLVATINVNGINNKGILSTNKGRDIVRGTATAKITAISQTVSQAIAYANTLDTAAITSTFAGIDINAIANGINNSGRLNTGQGDDRVDGNVDASIAAVATARADATAIVEGIAEACMNESLIAFADAIAISLANATIIATGIKNVGGRINTAEGADTINAIATSESNTLAETSAITQAAGTSENKALASAVAEAIAQAEDKAIAINNSQGFIKTGQGDDTIKAIAKASNKAIAIENSQGVIKTGQGDDTIKAIAKASNKAIAIENSQSLIRTGEGADTIIAIATGLESEGIFGGTIKTGNGADRIEASSFGGGVNINMGRGDDFVEGFGEAGVNGGKGFDILSLGSDNLEDFDIYFGTGRNEVVFQQDDIIMRTIRFEQFNFGDVSLSYHDLIAQL